MLAGQTLRGLVQSRGLSSLAAADATHRCVVRISRSLAALSLSPLSYVGWSCLTTIPCPANARFWGTKGDALYCPPTTGLKVDKVYVVHRHGDRAPIAASELTPIHTGCNLFPYLSIPNPDARVSSP